MSSLIERLNEALSAHVRLGSFPVAVRMVKEGETLPDKVKHPLKDLNIKVATCQAIAMSRRYGWVLALGRAGNRNRAGELV